GVKRSDGKTVEWMSYKETGVRVDNFRAGLAGLGVSSGDAVGIIANNRPEWAIAAFATYGLQARFIPMYEAELMDVWRYIIRDSAIKVLLVSKPEIYEKIKGFTREIEGLEKIILIDGKGENTMAALEEAGKNRVVPSTQPGAYDTAVLIYTSGTTGDPKGVLLSHGNLTHCARSGFHLFPELDKDSRSLSILPWAHSFGQTAELYNWLQFGGSIGFMESVKTLAEDLALVQPSFIIAVPRIFNKIYDGIQAKMKEEGGIKLRLFDMAVKTSEEKHRLQEQGHVDPVTSVKEFILDRLVFSKVRQRLGGHLQGALTGSATMNPKIAQFFFNMGVPLYDCYGLTETSPAVSMNCRDAYRLGSVGQPVERVKVVIDSSVVQEDADDGEIIVYGPNVMQGYNNKPEATKAVMTDDKGFRTGDRGRLDQDGFLYITGRIKEQFKLENGKYVFPSGIEEEIKLIPEVANAMIFGEGKPYNICLLHPDLEVLGKYATRHNLPTDPEQLVASREIHDLITDKVVSHLKGKYGGYEIPRKFVFLSEDFTLANGMLTQTMKLKRRVVTQCYKKDIEAQYK
ncbi:MAG: long-chain fatty acid--CoA ligase, partial [Thermodesulfobacteriota bacterium]|nr:long-chain fatty acid--CoA ligase [Thermodesulfobacteriota bacterium]